MRGWARGSWRRRFRVALWRLRQAGIRTVADEQLGARHYVALRAEWDALAEPLATALGYTREEIDPAGTHPERLVKGPPPMRHLAREPFPEEPEEAHGPVH